MRERSRITAGGEISAVADAVHDLETSFGRSFE